MIECLTQRRVKLGVKGIQALRPIQCQSGNAVGNVEPYRRGLRHG